jgi:hypothetical protein
MPRESAARLYEDVEIMRRLLEQNLRSHLPAAGTLLAFTSQQCQKCHDSSTNLLLDLSNGKIGANTLTNPRYSNSAVPNWNALWHSAVNRNWMSAHHGLLAVPRLEGVYLRNQGVVYTVTLPTEPGAAKPQPPKPAAKPLSEWERLRNQIRGEKPEMAPSAPERKEPTLADTLLKLLAENGHNFSELAPNESVTVVVTFRPVPAPGWGVAFADFDSDGYADLFITGTHGGNVLYLNNGDGTFTDVTATGLAQGSSASGRSVPTGSISGSGTTSSTAGTSGSTGGTPSSARDYLLLGDLLLKQGKAQEAVAAYTNAGKLLDSSSPADPAKADEQLRKLAQAHLAAGDVKNARAALDQLALARAAQGPGAKANQTGAPKGGSNARPAEAPKPTPPPAKLIVSATKKVLDQAGSGKLSFEDFKKAATVQFLDFAPAAGKP